jgi:RNA polymerase sigma-B factor
VTSRQRTLATADRESLIESHLPLAKSVARRYVGRGVELDDLVQVAAVGLVKAANRFDTRRGVSFGAFAEPTIEGEIRHHLRDRSSVVRLPRRLGAEGARVHVSPFADAHEAGIDLAPAADERLAIARAARALPARSRRLVALRFFGDLSQAQAAAAVGISPVHASRLIHEALGTLRDQLEETSPDGPGRAVARAAARD